MAGVHKLYIDTKVSGGWMKSIVGCQRLNFSSNPRPCLVRTLLGVNSTNQGLLNRTDHFMNHKKQVKILPIRNLNLFWMYCLVLTCFLFENTTGREFIKIKQVYHWLLLNELRNFN